MSQGKHKKEHVGYKVPVAETVTEAELENGEPSPDFNFVTTKGIFLERVRHILTGFPWYPCEP